MIVSDNILDYIIYFLTGKRCYKTINGIDYTRNIKKSPSKFIIYPSLFFDEGIYGTLKSIPKLPLQTIDDIPLLFGKPEITSQGDKTIIYADFIASTFYLISRYEETIISNLDNHGRYLGKKSIPFSGNFLNRPIVDEYSMFLQRKIMNLSCNNKAHPKIYLTHDVDTPYIKYDFLFSVLHTITNLVKRRKHFYWPLLNFFGNPKHDSLFTFDYLINEDNRIKFAEKIYFVKSGGNVAPQDSKIYIKDKSFKYLLKMLDEQNCKIGYHISYEGGLHPEKIISQELSKLNSIVKRKILLSRNHYLCSRHPNDMRYLLENGIHDDFTMGYADISGFRLGTCRPVNWIDLTTMNVTELILHPLLIMDCSLTSKNYMNLNINEAYNYSIQLIEWAYKIDGSEIVLLWHNKPYDSKEYELYDRIIAFLNQKESMYEDCKINNGNVEK